MKFESLRSGLRAVSEHIRRYNDSFTVDQLDIILKTHYADIPKYTIHLGRCNVRNCSIQYIEFEETGKAYIYSKPLDNIIDLESATAVIHKPIYDCQLFMLNRAPNCVDKNNVLDFINTNCKDKTTFALGMLYNFNSHNHIFNSVFRELANMNYKDSIIIK